MIEIGNLSFSYKQLDLFRDLNMDFKSGRIYGLLGKNGAGKTTLFKLICGMLKPKTGYCDLQGLNSAGRHPKMLQELFFIPETYYLPAVTIKQYVSLHAPFYPLFDRDIFEKYLSELELHDWQSLNALSYGLSKRFLLAFGLATRSKVLLLDEPTNGLDIPSKRVFRKLLAGGIDDDRLFIIATHQIREMENIFDHLVFINHGRIMMDSSVENIASKLTFRSSSSIESPQNVIYREEIPGGYAVIEKNETGEESTLDLEFLFNAVMESKEDFQLLLHQDEENRSG